ncbi:MAG: hypothetical protein ACI8SE_001416 [Bacteroidia bacterium]|jgi:hypothetical protein
MKIVNLIIAVLVLLNCSCNEDETNLSKLHISGTSGFYISSIQKGPNDEIICVGTIGVSDSTLIYRYDRNLRLKEMIPISSMENFGGQLSITCLQENGWIVNRVPKSLSPQITTLKLDQDFNIEHSTDLNVPDTVLKIKLFNINRLSSGKYLMSMNYQYPSTVTTTLDGNLVWLDENLNKTKSHPKADGHSYRFIELPDNTVVIASNFTRVGWIPVGPTSFRWGELNVRITELLEPNGTMRYLINDTLAAIHSEVIGISYTGSSFIYNAIIDDEHIQHYSAIDVQTGEQTDESLLPANYINNQLVTSYFNGHFPLGQANPLPTYLGPGQGHVIYSEVDKKLYFLSVDKDANTNFNFTIPVPDFSEVYSYRQMFTDAGTMLVGTSYKYNMEDYFTLLELDMLGNVVSE